MCAYHLNDAIRRERRFEQLAFGYVRLEGLRQLRVSRAWVYCQDSRGRVKAFQLDTGRVQQLVERRFAGSVAVPATQSVIANGANPRGERREGRRLFAQ